VKRPPRSEIDAAYVAYDKHPLDQPDEWGDLASFRERPICAALEVAVPCEG
jgi:hypothetical protein